jgi:hypothetical protein
MYFVNSGRCSRYDTCRCYTGCNTRSCYTKYDTVHPGSVHRMVYKSVVQDVTHGVIRYDTRKVLYEE